MLAPLRPYLDKYRHWVFSPDGELWRLPFAALPYDDDFLVQKKIVSYVISGRHIVPQAGPESVSAPTIFAGIDYGDGGEQIFTQLPLRNAKALISNLFWNVMPAD